MVRVLVSLLLGVAFAIGGLVMLAPQFRRTWSSRAAAGVSAAAVAAQSCTDAAWVVYGVHRDDPAIYLSSAGTCLGNIAILVALVRAGVGIRTIAAAAAVTGVPVLVAALISPVAVGVVAGVAVVFMFLPQLVLAGRRFARGKSLDGISLLTWCGHVGACSLWMVYAWWRHDWVLLLTEAVLVPVVAAVLVLAVLDRRRRAT